MANPLGPLRPNHTSGQDRFLKLNVTSEQLELDAISGPIPNRGLLQADINMFGLTYLLSELGRGFGQFKGGF